LVAFCYNGFIVINKGKKMDYKNLIGWVGMAMLQFNSIPAIFSAIENGTKYPLATMLLTIGGLGCYMVRAIADNDKLYIVGNSIGIIGNLILLFVTIY
jgi:uncharacterized protein with PQ loop repeat